MIIGDKITIDMKSLFKGIFKNDEYKGGNTVFTQNDYTIKNVTLPNKKENYELHKGFSQGHIEILATGTVECILKAVGTHKKEANYLLRSNTGALFWLTEREVNMGMVI